MYTVQEVVDGEVPPVLRFEHVRELVALWSVHQNVAITVGHSGGGWAENVVRGLRVGTEAVYVDHQVLRASSDRRVQRVLDAAIAIGMRTDPGIFRTGDVVHGDFHHRNLLVRGDHVVAVFDWEGAHPGDARTDLMTLASMPSREQIDPRGTEFLSEQLQTIPAEVREPLAALGAAADHLCGPDQAPGAGVGVGQSRAATGSRGRPGRVLRRRAPQAAMSRPTDIEPSEGAILYSASAVTSSVSRPSAVSP